MIKMCLVWLADRFQQRLFISMTHPINNAIKTSRFYENRIEISKFDEKGKQIANKFFFYFGTFGNAGFFVNVKYFI